MKLTLNIKISIVILFSIALAYIIYAIELQHHETLAQEKHGKTRQQAQNVAQQLEFRLRLFYQGLRTIARLPGIQNLDKNNFRLNFTQKQSIQDIYNNLAENFQLTEIYVISKEFDPAGKRHTKPLLAFEKVSEIPGAISSRNIHPEEDEKLEYQELYQQLQVFLQKNIKRDNFSDLSYPARISRQVLTCDRSKQLNLDDETSRQGIVYSVPYYDTQGNMQGMISGVLLTSAIFENITTGHYSLLQNNVRIATNKLALTHTDNHEHEDFNIKLSFKDEANNWVLLGQTPVLFEGNIEITIILLGAIITIFLIILYLFNQEKYKQKLIEGEEKITTVLASTFDAIITINQYGIVDSFNTSAEKIFGYSASEVIGNNVSMLMPEDIAEHHDHYLERHVHTGTAKIVGLRRETVAQRKNGEQFPIALAVTDIEVKGKKYYTGVISDITEVKQQQNEIYQHRHHLEELVEEKTAEAIIAKDAAEKAYHAKSEFLANMSHELRTPMHTILSFAELGTKKYASATPDKILQYFNRIQEGGQRQLNLLNDLLDLSKLEAGKVIYKFSTNNIMNVINDQVAHHDALAEQKHLTFALNAEIKNTNAFFDHDKIAQVVRNLLSNAIKFADDGTEIRIRIFAHKMKKNNESTDTIATEVSDTGVAIPFVELKHVFEKFVQSSNTNTGAGGTGLGLSICHEIVEAHGGHIWANSDGKNMTSFTFCLPLSET